MAFNYPTRFWRAVVARMRAHWRSDIEAAEGRATAALRTAVEAAAVRWDKKQPDVEAVMQSVRAEYTVLPRFAYHQPLDYLRETLPPKFDPPVFVDGEELPLPPRSLRSGYPIDEALYLESGRYDHDLIVSLIDKHGAGRDRPLDILDFGCSTGRVLRHFERERAEHGWRLNGVDLQARLIEWQRQNFPDHFRVFTSCAIPHLPFEDNSFDVIYGMSVFTHIKFLWDEWLMELRRILRPGGLLIQTIHAEAAWETYYKHRHAPEFQKLSPIVLNNPHMVADYLYDGDLTSQQVFWKREVARKFWSRYVTVLDILPPPPKHSFQDWMICRKG